MKFLAPTVIWFMVHHQSLLIESFVIKATELNSSTTIHLAPTSRKVNSPILKIKPKSRCTDIYKVSMYINNAPNILPIISKNIQMYTISCIPSSQNTFCLKDDEITKYWNDYQACHWSDDGKNIECPLYRHFTDFNDYHYWNTRLIVIRVRAIVPGVLPNDKNSILFTTKGAVVRPLFKCKNGGKIKSDDPMFLKTAISH